eukprot:1157258-Pelagomonas_calceolata.AAC.6
MEFWAVKGCDAAHLEKQGKHASARKGKARWLDHGEGVDAYESKCAEGKLHPLPQEGRVQESCAPASRIKWCMSRLPWMQATEIKAPQLQEGMEQEEKEQAITAINAELVALRQEAVASAAAAEARGKRLGAIEKEVAEAQMKAQQASLAEEKEVRACFLGVSVGVGVSEPTQELYIAELNKLACLNFNGAQVVLRHRLSSDILAELADKEMLQTFRISQIRTASSTVNEREERTLYVLERDVKDREARVASREKLLSERESRDKIPCNLDQPIPFAVPARM